MKSKKVLVVEDDEVTALNLKISLEKQGYSVCAIADDAVTAKSKMKVYSPDIVIIDISLQESDDGIKLANYIREKQLMPFIFLTAHSDDHIIEDASKTEPYGYIIKPFDPANLHVTIQMALYKYDQEKKRNENFDSLKVDKLNLEKLLYNKKLSDKPIVPFGDKYFLDISVCETFYENKKIRLTKKENSFIRLLVAQLGLVVTFEQAIGYVWEEDGATDNSVRTLVWRLRNKLPTDIIKNASGMGYYIED